MRLFLCISILVTACGDNLGTCPVDIAAGDGQGHADPLGAGPGEVRAGRLEAADLPAASELLTWQPGDFVLANDRVAIVIEDAGDSDLYDPWGGRPVGLARIEGGRMVEPSTFGELFLLTGRSSVITRDVTVIADGSDGGPAIVRARGTLHPLPFFEALTAVLFADEMNDIEAAIDYELAPGADHVDIRFRYASPRSTPTRVPSTLHALMYTKRTNPSAFQPGRGFDDELSGARYVALVEDDATSWAYLPGEGQLASSIAASGFLGAFTGGFDLAACGATDRVHARIVIGGPGLDALQAAVARTLGEQQRTINGTVTSGGAGFGNVRVHAVDPSGAYLTRVTPASDGSFSLRVPAGASVRLETFARGQASATADVGSASGPVTLDVPEAGSVRVVVTENGTAVPARVQLLPASGQTLPGAPGNYGEPSIPDGRLHVAFPVDGDVTLPVPPGDWEVIASRGYEYEVERQTISVTSGQTTRVDLALERSVDTGGVQCGDFHVHTRRSNDSGDDGTLKVQQAIADGLELPVRSEHEFIADFKPEIAELGAQAFAAGFGSIELTSFQLWGHMGVFPLTPDPSRPNAGAPIWQTFPTAAEPERPFETRAPPLVFEAVRARPESPVVIINHPRGATNYFDYVGFNPATGLVEDEGAWDSKFTLVEVFNDAGWLAERDRNVADWFGLLNAGRKIVAVGSSDSHGITGSPVGYPRTCISLGTDDPRQLTAAQVRDQLAAGHATVSGGIYIKAQIGNAGPGDSVTGAGSPMHVDVTVQAATWIDVDAIDVVVDGVTVDTIPVAPGDADPNNPVVRWQGQIPVQVRATGGFVVIAAHGNATLEPVHRGKLPFGVTNPIHVTP